MKNRFIFNRLFLICLFMFMLPMIVMGERRNIDVVGLTNNKCYSLYVKENYAYVSVSPYNYDYRSDLTIYNVSNPSKMSYVGQCYIGFEIKDIRVSGNYAYISENDGYKLQIVDVSNPSSPVLLGLYNSTKKIDIMEISGNYACIITGRTVEIIDVSNPSNPAFVGSYSLPQYSIISGIKTSGNYVYIASYLREVPYSRYFYIFDISNPSQITLTGTYTFNIGSAILFDFSILDNFAYVPDGNNKINVIDLSDPNNPTLVTSFAFPDYSMDYYIPNIYVANSFAYTLTSKGLYILNISDLSDVKITGVFDEFGSDAQFYYLFPSGNNIFCNSIYNGIIALKFPITKELLSTDFYQNEEDWVTGSEEQYFTSPDFSYEESSIVIQSKDANTYGYWKSPSNITYDPNVIYRATFTVRGTAKIAEAPAFRYHFDTQSATTFGGVVVESWMGGAESPGWDPMKYVIYFDPRTQTDFPNLSVGFDMMSFNPDDNVYGAYLIDGVTVEAIDKTVIVPTTVKTYDTTEEFSNWVFGSYPQFNATLKYVGDGSIGHIANNDNSNTYGFWESSRTAIDVRTQADTLYRARFTVASNAAQNSCPQLRLRIGTESNKMTSYYVVNSNLDGINSPSFSGKDYDVYFYPPQSDINDPDYKNGLIFAMDMLNFGGADSTTGNLILKKVIVDTINLNMDLVP